jgi:hypothetical protein
MFMEVPVLENRGATPKYDFRMEVGDIRQFTGTYSATIINCSKSFCSHRGLDWEFRSWTENGVVFLVRVK